MSPLGENLRAQVLCQPWRISQSLKSVSHMLNISESQVCVYVKNISILLICVIRTENLRVSSLCLTCRISLYLPCCLSIMLVSVSAMQYISGLEVCVCCVEYLRKWVLCLAWNISGLKICVRCAEEIRSWDLCLSCWVSQILRSVSSVLNISVLDICVTIWWKSQSSSAVSTMKNISES